MDHWFWVLVVLMVFTGLSICVHVHGPLVWSFGSFHGFDQLASVSTCICVCVCGLPVLSFGGFHGFDGTVHLCAYTWTTGLEFWQFSRACPSVCMYMDQWFWVLAVFTVLIDGPIYVCVYP